MRDDEFIAKCRAARDKAHGLGYLQTAATLQKMVDERCDLNRLQAKSAADLVETIS